MSTEGTTQGDPVSMAIYAIATIPLLLQMTEFSEEKNLSTKNAAYADDMAASGKLTGLKFWWEELCRLGPKYGYFPNAAKTWVITKDEHLEKAKRIFKGTNVQITTEGKRHLGAALGKEKFKREFVNLKVDGWIKQLRILSKIAETEPQAAYTGFVSGFKHKISYSMRTLPEIATHLDRVDDCITAEFIPAITGGINCSNELRELLSLPPKLGGLGIPIFANLSEIEHQNSEKLTQSLVKNIMEQERIGNPNDTQKIKNQLKNERKNQHKKLLNDLRCHMDNTSSKLNELASEKGASSWLTTLPIEEEGFNLPKQLFWDLLRIRYGFPLQRLPATCECGHTYNIEHALSCKKGGFISLRHNELRNTIASLLSQICKDVTIEPSLTKTTGESFSEKTAIVGDEARLDIRARGFWQAGQSAFFDIRVFNPIAKRHVNQELRKCYEINEKEKKRGYNQRVLEIEHGSFTPLVFSATGGLGREYWSFVRPRKFSW